MKILYICTHNRCRSVLSEAITNNLSNGKIQAFSAGSQPVGKVHPLSLKYLDEKGISIKGLMSQSWDAFELDQPDVVVTVCDNAANEVCPVWFGNTVKVHWGLPDPSKLEGCDNEIKDAFLEVMNTIEQRVQALLELDFVSLSKQELQTAMNNLVKT